MLNVKQQKAEAKPCAVEIAEFNTKTFCTVKSIAKVNPLDVRNASNATIIDGVPTAKSTD